MTARINGRLLTAATLLLSLCGCAKFFHGTSAASPAPSPLFQTRGTAVSLSEAVHRIAFRPYLPQRRLIGVALIPPLGGPDLHTSHGIAIEYARGSHRLLLSEWPRRGFDVRTGAAAIAATPCTAVFYAPQSLMWATRNGLVMTLQPDGHVAAGSISSEARNFIARGACGPSRSSGSPARPRRRASSSPRRSAF